LPAAARDLLIGAGGVCVNWLPVAQDFRDRLQRANAAVDAAERLRSLLALSQHRMSVVEELQFDRALAKATAALDPPSTGLLPARIALLSSATVDQLLPAVRLALVRRGLLADVHTGGFDQYRQELLAPASSLLRFRPEFVVLSLTARSVLAPLALDCAEEQAERAVHNAIETLRPLWRAARERFDATVIQQSLLDTSMPVFGNLDRQVPGTPHRLAQRLNDALAQAAATDGVLLLDVARAAARDGLDAWFDVRHWLQAKMEIAPAAAPRFADLLARLVAAQRGRSRKCLVLDLDNTLWGGVIGDDGIDGIVLGEGSARGEAHLALQRYARLLKERGVILAACSKNDPDVARAALRGHPDMVLHEDDFAAFMVDWEDKARNLVRIAERLNIGLDGLVFVDDNPAERERIRGALPAVAVPELPDDPAGYVRCLAEAGYFEAVTFSEDDRHRAEQYGANARRESFRELATGMDAFLQGLAMQLAAGPVQPVDSARAVQLINKTNQFNTTTRRLSDAEFDRFVRQPGNLALQFRLRDRFGDNGLVSAMLLENGAEGDWRIENWVMSCRVFGRQLEDEALNVAAEHAAQRGKRRIVAEFIPTEKNKVIADLYERLGFDCVERRADGSSRWELRLAGFAPRRTSIARAS
jgi:FkbH-like protein